MVPAQSLLDPLTATCSIVSFTFRSIIFGLDWVILSPPIPLSCVNVFCHHQSPLSCVNVVLMYGMTTDIKCGRNVCLVYKCVITVQVCAEEEGDQYIRPAR